MEPKSRIELLLFKMSILRILRVFLASMSLIAGWFCSIGHAQQIPSNYRLLYEEDFEGEVFMEDFVTSDPEAWRIGEGKEGKALELHGKSSYDPPFRSPHKIAFIKGKKFGSFILEAELQQTGEEYGHRDLCIFFGLKDPSNFYYVHMASSADPNAHNIFLVNDAPRTSIATNTTVGVNWGSHGEWHKMRLERNIETGMIRLFFDDMDTPIMEAEDEHFKYGHIGFGSFDDFGKFDNIRIWGPELGPEKEGFFIKILQWTAVNKVKIPN